jgi:hypothetical protein
MHPSSLSPLQKGHITAVAQRSQGEMPYRVDQTHASLHIHFIFEVLCALGVSAVRFCSEVSFLIEFHGVVAER